MSRQKEWFTISLYIYSRVTKTGRKKILAKVNGYADAINCLNVLKTKYEGIDGFSLTVE